MNTKEIQPSLFKLPESTQDISDFLTERGKKKSSISTGMTREDKDKLAKDKAKRGPAAIGADDWARK